MNLDAINNMDKLRAAKPPSECKIKREQECEIKDLTAQFLANGGEIEQVASFGIDPKHLTFKQGNDSTHGSEL